MNKYYFKNKKTELYHSSESHNSNYLKLNKHIANTNVCCRIEASKLISANSEIIIISGTTITKTYNISLKKSITQNISTPLLIDFKLNDRFIKVAKIDLIKETRLKVKIIK